MASILKSDKVVFVLVVALSITSFNILAQETQNDITRIMNQTTIHCVSELFNKAMYTIPLLERVQDSENLVETGKWENDDWELKNSSNIRSNVDDKRWEDFKVTKGKYFRFIGPNISVSFSVSGVKEIEFLADNGESLKYFKESINNVEEWTTFNIFLEDNNIHYLMNNNYIQKQSLQPTQVVMKMANDGHFKMHTYKYKEATEVTNPQEYPTSLIIPPSNKTTLIVYSSLCKSCVLELQYDGHRLNIISNTTKTDLLERWQAHNFSLDSSKENKVNFIRKKINQTEKGYWKLDVRLYYNAGNAVGYNHSTDKPEKKYECKYLQTPNRQKSSKRNFNHKEISPLIADCRPGMVGPKCDISCKNVLGQQYPRCEEHKICSSTHCHCAWGYNGTHCDKECPDGHWGLDCQNTCENCLVCNKRTGNCSDFENKDHNHIWVMRLQNERTGNLSVTDDGTKLEKKDKHGTETNWMSWSNITVFVILLTMGAIAIWMYKKHLYHIVSTVIPSSTMKFDTDIPLFINKS